MQGQYSWNARFNLSVWIGRTWSARLAPALLVLDDAAVGLATSGQDDARRMPEAVEARFCDSPGIGPLKR